MSSDPLPSLTSQLWSPTLRLAQVRLLRLTDRAPRVPPRGRLPRERSPLAKGSERVAQGSPKSSLLLLHCQPASPPFHSIPPHWASIPSWVSTDWVARGRKSYRRQASSAAAAGQQGQRRPPIPRSDSKHMARVKNSIHIFRRTLC